MIIENSGFEFGLDNWGVFNGTATIISDAFAGANALSLESNSAGIDQGFSVLAGETYTISGYGKTTESAWSGLGITFYDDEWTLLDKTSTRITSQDWAEYSFDVLAPEGANRGIVWAWKGGDSGTTQVDEITVNGSTPPPPPPPPTDGELLTNPGFENSLSAWNTFKDSEATTTDAFEGSLALQLSENGSGISQALDIIGGETYQLSGYGRYTGDLRGGLGIDFWDASWNRIEGYSTQINGAEWQLYEITQDAPANAAHATVWSWKGGDSGSAFLDALSVQVIDEPPANQAPTITSNNGADSATLSISENSTSITNLEAIDPDGDTEGNGLTYSLDGPDVSQIAIDPNTGQLSFNSAPDFESPTDANQDNIYDVTVVVADSQGAQDSQQLDIAVTDVNPTISFNQIGAFKGLEGGPNVISNPTSIQFGPDGRLYVSEQTGTINAFTVTLQNGTYSATSLEEINLVKEIQNHNDDGTLNSSGNRQVTGILVTGTATNPVLYVSSSDPRIAANGEVNLDTNSGVITRLTRNGNSWSAVDIVRGLPRSEENHANNGLVLSPDGTQLYVAVGGNTNNGAPSQFFSYTGEYALSGTVLEIDLADINSRPILTDNAPGQNGRQYIYDLPTLDDPTIPNITDGVGEDEFGLDEAGPWGGNDGFNMAILPADAPLRIYADGFRNHYDLVMTAEGQLYTVDNGSNGNLGGNPITSGTGQATNQPNNGGTGDPEPLFLIEEGGYYGHPNPARSNQSLAWTVYDDSGNPDTSISPNSVLSLADLVPASVTIQDGFIIDPSKFTADPARLLESGIRVERDSPDSNALITVGSSSNGLVEYTGDAFGGELNGDLLVAQFNGNIGRLNLNASGTAATYETISGLSGLSVPLDVTLGPNGTIWATEIGGDFIKVFSPSDLVIPGDPDADDDGILNVNDPFIRDASNGASAIVVPGQTLLWDFDANQDDNLPGPDGYGGGLTGVMIDGTTDFEEFFQEPSSLPGQDIKLDNVKFITAAGGGTTVIETVSSGDPIGPTNSGEYLFHTGVTIAPTVDTFTVKWSVFNPGSDLAEAFQQIGGYIGTGDQSNYLKLVAIQGSTGELELLLEDGDVVQSQSFFQADDLFEVPVNSKIFFELTVDPAAATATPTVTYETATGNKVVAGTAISLAGTAVLEAIQGTYTVNGQTTGLAVGLFSSNNGALPQPDFQAIFDDIEITATGSTDSTVLYRVNAGGGAVASLDGGPDWTADLTSNPSPFLVNPGSNSSASFPALDPGNTVPLTIPGTIFDTERWESAGGAEMQWEFSVPSGVYDVRLFMGNGWSGANDPGERVFDVAIEGIVFNTLNDVDLSAQFGHEVGGLISNVVEVTDGSLSLEFLHVIQNPLINGIEILQLG